MFISWWREKATQVFDATRFLSRLPLPASGSAPWPLAITLRVSPLAGVLIAAGPAACIVLLARAGLPSLAVATLANAALALATGGLHEDGLADTADGLGGGHTVDRKLEIMRDSRIGTFGTLAISTSLLLRVAGLQALVERSGPGAAALALVAAAALSRAMMLVPLTLLPPARPDGLAHEVTLSGQPDYGAALLLGLPIAGLLALAVTHDGLLIASGILLSAAAALALSHLARRQIGGVTGDIVGATQQTTELTFLLTLCTGARPF